MRVSRAATVLILSILINATAASVVAQQKKPWEWTVEERIAARCDRDAARARIEKARAAKLAPTRTRDGKTVWSDVGDVIRGREDPHLFLPTELFEMVMMLGFVLEGGRESFENKVAEYGLPVDFWQQLEQAAPLYIQDLRDAYALATMRDHVAQQRLQAALMPRTCRDRHDAFVKARELFGPKLDVFMYGYVARNKHTDIGHIENPADLRSRERGCR